MYITDCSLVYAVDPVVSLQTGSLLDCLRIYTVHARGHARGHGPCQPSLRRLGPDPLTKATSIMASHSHVQNHGMQAAIALHTMASKAAATWHGVMVHYWQ